MRVSLFVLLFIPFIAFTQGRTDEEKKSMPFYIETCVDKVTDQSYAFPSKGLMCTDDGKKGFYIIPSFSFRNGKVSFIGLAVTSAQIGNCVEKSVIYFLFDDDSKFQLTAFNDFNCEGKNYMDINGRLMSNYTQKKVKVIRFQNGRTYDSFTYNLSESEQSYFIEVAAAITQQRIEQTTCDY